MKLLFGFSVGVLFAGVIFLVFREEPQPPKDAAPDPVVAPTPDPNLAPVPFLITSRVKIIWEQHLKLSTATSRGDRRPAETRMRMAIEDIEERLLQDGLRDRHEMLELVRLAAVKAGLNERQCEAIVSAFLQGRAR